MAKDKVKDTKEEVKKHPSIEKYDKKKAKNKKLLDQANSRMDMQVVTQDGDNVVTITTVIEV